MLEASFGVEPAEVVAAEPRVGHPLVVVVVDVLVAHHSRQTHPLQSPPPQQPQLPQSAHALHQLLRTVYPLRLWLQRTYHRSAHFRLLVLRQKLPQPFGGCLQGVAADFRGEGGVGGDGVVAESPAHSRGSH